MSTAPNLQAFGPLVKYRILFCLGCEDPTTYIFDREYISMVLPCLFSVYFEFDGTRRLQDHFLANLHLYRAVRSPIARGLQTKKGQPE